MLGWPFHDDCGSVYPVAEMRMTPLVTISVLRKTAL